MMFIRICTLPESSPSAAPRPPHPARAAGRLGPKVRPERKGPTRVELISIGAELLRGHGTDENAAELARWGRIYMHRFRPTYPMHARPLDTP